MNELSFWDYVTLGVALIVICGYIAIRIKRALDGSSGAGCSGCSKGSCVTPTAINMDGCKRDESDR